VDEAVYQSVSKQIKPLPCVFEKALLCQAAVCEAAQRLSLAERELVACREPLVRTSCNQLLALLRKNSVFTLKLKETPRTLPHAMSMKIQCGGLVGLKDILDSEAHAPDVLKLVRLSQTQFGTLENLPFSLVVRGIAGWQVRKRRPARP